MLSSIHRSIHRPIGPIKYSMKPSSFKRINPFILRLSLLVLGICSANKPSQAQNAGFAPYTIEVTPYLGLNLPYDLWGTPGTFSTKALRAAYKFNEKALLRVGAVYQSAGADKVYTGDAVIGWELTTADLYTTFHVGFHFSRFNLDIDYDDEENCIPANCQTDSGNHSGIAVGAGLMIPISEKTPLRLGMTFYTNPQLWLLLEMGIGFRF